MAKGLKEKEKVNINVNILAILNTFPSDVKTILKTQDIRLRLVSDVNVLIPEKDDKHIYGFTSSISLSKNYNRLCRPPILWETATVVHHISLNHPLIYLDAKRYIDGLVAFFDLDEARLVSEVGKRFEPTVGFIIEKGQPVQYGNGSRLSLALNTFLSQIPSFCVEPTLTALTWSLKSDNPDIFNKYLESNRLVTNTNSKAFQALNSLLTELRPVLEAILGQKMNKAHKKYLASLSGGLRSDAQRIRFLLNHWGKKKLEDYLDDEHNVNVVTQEENKSKSGLHRRRGNS